MIGMHATTEIHYKEFEDHWECRQGFGMFGGQNMTDEQLDKINRDPFHAEFYDNYHFGKGSSKEEALENMKSEMGLMAESIWF